MSETNSSNIISSSNITDDFCLKIKVKNIQKKFGINIEFIEEKDIPILLEQMKIGYIPKLEIKKMFDRLDIEKTGKLKINSLIEDIITYRPETTSSNLYGEILLELTSKSERIIQKLKKLKEKAYFANDTDSLQDFDW